MAKTLHEILEIARRWQLNEIQALSCLELEVLFSKLNRVRYSLEDQEEFIRFYMAAYSALQECRAGKAKLKP